MPPTGKVSLASKRHRRCSHAETLQALTKAFEQITAHCRRVKKPLTAEEADRLSIPCYFELLSAWDKAIDRAMRNGVYDAITNGELREAIDARLVIRKALGTTRRARLATTSKPLSQQDRALFDAMRELKKSGTKFNQRQIALYLKSKGLFNGSRWSLKRKLAAIGCL